MTDNFKQALKEVFTPGKAKAEEALNVTAAKAHEYFNMAGVAGFEPTNDGVKVRCLTAWLHPNVQEYTSCGCPVSTGIWGG
jgi:hypothetical protein